MKIDGPAYGDLKLERLADGGSAKPHPYGEPTQPKAGRQPRHFVYYASVDGEKNRNAIRSPWQKFHEPFSATLLRNGIIALVVGAIIARFWGGIANWPLATLVALWPSLGGHYVETWFLNGLRPRLPISRPVLLVMRITVWFVGGIGLVFAMGLTARALAPAKPMHWTAWWIGGTSFIGLELAAHLVLQLWGRPSFYNGKG